MSSLVKGMSPRRRWRWILELARLDFVEVAWIETLVEYQAMFKFILSDPFCCLAACLMGRGNHCFSYHRPSLRAPIEDYSNTSGSNANNHIYAVL